MNKLESILHKHKRPVKVVEVSNAPQCTRVRLTPQSRTLASGKPGATTRVSHLRSLSLDIAAELGVRSVNIATNERGIWLEVPKTKPDLVLARDLRPGLNMSLPVVLGVGVQGETVGFDLSEASTPHALVAGTTGSGKSILLHSIIRGLCANTDYMNTYLVLIDTHSHESEAGSLKNHDGLGVWRESAHVCRAVTTAREALVYLEAATSMVRERYSKSSSSQKYIFVIDELADLLSHPEYGDDIQAELIWLLANARKQGVHIIAATQRPSSDVTKGLLKANFPVRIGMTVASAIDSRIILDWSGAERLHGRGDGLVKIGAEVTRFQGAWVDDGDAQSVLRRAAPQEKEVVVEKKSKKGPLWSQIIKWWKREV